MERRNLQWRDLLKAAIFFSVVITLCNGHGRLYEPPSRASAWRFGFNTPRDYNDNEGFCGGFSHQYETQDGKCGICGDPWDQSPRAHEVGGIFATGLVVRHYLEGQVLNITVLITANHLGHFEARICPDPEIEANQECLDKHRLSLADGSGNEYKISSEIGLYTMMVQLPPGLTCQHCVLQWRYETGNNWGRCSDGTSGLGCGPQEEFRACADISIRPNSSLRSPQLIDVAENSIEVGKGEEVLPLPRDPLSRNLQCKGTGAWTSLLGAAKWCMTNCNSPPFFCPKSLCVCS
ncbi:uncharacterized protein [Palaemon carinicauda]|uniref:uncharacterized protein n=1 Tax=Palaemon carinicauda TaxID=392227 RepID=UPI0035B63CE3